MNVFSLDIECTTHQKGDPFDQNNHLVLGAYGSDTTYNRFYAGDVAGLQNALDTCSLVILFNAKFDLHWIRRIGCRFSHRLPIWDCQLAEFILSNQRWKYPSLDEACAKQGLPRKLDVVKTEYWDKGIDTDKVPFEILDDYLRGDITSTYLLYLNQVERFKQPEHQKKLALFRMQCYDLLVLEEMEYKGYTFNVPAALEEAAVLDSQSKQLATKILSLFPNVPINLSSPDHISCILYGGTIVDVVKVPIGVFKTGNKIGEIRYKNLEQPYILPRLIEPLKNSALKKEGYFATNEDVLMNLKAKGVAKKIIETLLEIRGLEKLRGTYYEGIPKLIEEHAWENNVVHGNLNQCVVTTSRLSATKPNQQNLPSGCKLFCISRYDT